MTNIEKIRKEIERLKKILEESTYYLDNSQQALGYSFALDDFSAFIDSLPEENLSYVTDSPGDPGHPGEPGISDLEQAAARYERENRQSVQTEEMIKAVLECRLTIVRLSLNKYNPSPEQRLYLEGKADGYQQAIDLLNATDKSIGIEL